MRNCPVTAKEFQLNLKSRKIVVQNLLYCEYKKNVKYFQERRQQFTCWNGTPVH
jgi:hypothetical protein